MEALTMLVDNMIKIQRDETYSMKFGMKFNILIKCNHIDMLIQKSSNFI